MKFAAIVAILGALVLIGVVSCRQMPTPIPVPASVPVDQLYDFYQQEKETNPPRLDQRVVNEEIRTFTGTITKIEDSKIQFHIQELDFGKDKYLECKFSSKGSVLNLNTGSTVTVYGFLDDANGVIKFKNCVVIQ